MILQPLLICGEYSVIKELQGRFRHFMETGDDSRIPADLQNVTFSTVRACPRSRNKTLITDFSRLYGMEKPLYTMLLLLSMKSQRRQQPELLQCRLI